MKNPIVIIGTGLAGYQLAREFRKLDENSPLLLLTAHDGRFYPKPQLSTAQTNKKTAESLATATAEAMATQLHATIRTKTTVTAIDPDRQSLSVGTETIAYQQLILACGAEVIKAPLTGNGEQDVLSINHLEDYALFETRIQDKKRIAILGAGLIGCEFANDLSNQGHTVHLIDPAPTPISLLLPDTIGTLLQTALEKNGVHFHLGCTAKTINKSEHTYTVTLSDNTTIISDSVISAIGLKPAITLAKTAGIDTGRGVLVNRYLETNKPHIYALGDCAEVEGHVLPYIAPILNAARALAKTLTGERTAVDYPAMPVVIKTPAHPIAVCPPPRGIQGQWQIENNDGQIKALFYNAKNELYGFVLTNDYVKERMSLANRLPKLI